ncbi:MAG: YfhO family protein [Candidatus Euphemobacter frigidus]|nr:YfhO family protein [Candidatus Euphemobacter frigidus]
MPNPKYIYAWLLRCRKDLIYGGILLVLISIFFIPSWMSSFGIFHDDLAMDEFPRLCFFARNLQEGTIPLWRTDTWCGARVLYTDYYSTLYYIPLWPLLLTARLDSLDLAYLWIYLIPLYLHFLICSIGAYLLARSALKLSPPGAFILAAFYTFSPVFAFGYVWISNLMLQAWIPWLLLVYIVHVKRAGFYLLLIGGIIVALMLSTSALPYLAYTLLFLSFACAGLMVGRLARWYSFPLWRPPLLLTGYLLIGLGLTAIYWFPALESIYMVKQSGMMTYDFATKGEGSLHPLYLSSLIVPGLFGGLNGTHLWGLGQVRYWEANMTGGLAVTLLVLMGVILPWSLPKGEKKTRILRLLAGTGGVVYLFSLLCMLGRHTFFYRMLWNYLPLIGEFPCPIRYRLLQCLAAAVLGGLGMHLLLRRAAAVEMLSRRIVTSYLIAVVIIIAGILLWPPMKVMEVIEKGDLAWFLTSPILHLVLGIVLIYIISRWAAPRRFAYLLAILAMLEIGYTAFQAFYLGTFQMGAEIYPQHIRTRGPGSHPMYRRALSELPRYIKDGSLRIASDQPFYDNLQQCGPYFSFMGYDMKPLEPRFQEAIEAAYQHPMEWNYLYGIHKNYPRAVHPSFYSNMSVGYFLSQGAVNPFPHGITKKLDSLPDYYLHINQHALPRVFTMDRVVECSEDEALDELVKGDLRKAVFIEDGKQLSEDSDQLSVIGNQDTYHSRSEPGLTDYRLPITDYESLISDYHSFKLHPASIKHFNELQSANPIKELELSNPNRIEVDIAVTKPAMLVLTEIWYPGWEAKVDGEAVPLYRVNYLQRGVWLDRGSHGVELIFRPLAWRIGAIISAASWGGLILLLLGYGVRKRWLAKR